MESMIHGRITDVYYYLLFVVVMHEDDDDSEDEVSPPLISLLSPEAEGKSLVDQRIGGVKHFDAFLERYYEEKGFIFESYDEILSNIAEKSVEFFTPDLFGLFGDFLISVIKLSWSSAHNYLSGLRGQIEYDFDKKSQIVFCGSWYKKLRKNIVKLDLKINFSRADGAAPAMETKDGKIMSEQLFKLNSNAGNMQRSLFCSTRQTFGRIVESTRAQYDKIGVTHQLHVTTADLTLKSSKKAKMKMSRICMGTDWKKCWFHSLATLCAVNRDSSNYLLPGLISDWRRLPLSHLCNLWYFVIVNSN